jgi:Serine/threonine protein kinase
MICEETSTSISSSTYSSEEEQYKTTANLFQDIEFVKPLNKAKFPVYLARSNLTKELFAVKIFPLYNGNAVHFYWNEIRFANLAHENVVSIVHHESHREVTKDGQTMAFSCTMMEYAPYGDFFDLLMTHKIPFDDKLARTYFHQLINGLEYLHSIGICHMDIKPENILVGDNFQLKLADFDLSYFQGDIEVKGKGTKNYRAPELINKKCENPQAADIFSAAIFLFLLKSGGIIPQMEEVNFKGLNLYELLQRKNQHFWVIHDELKGKRNFYSEDFKELFNMMTREDVSQRATIEQIRKSKWYNQEIYSNHELTCVMRKHFGL